MDKKLYALAETAGAALKGRRLLLATAESCTGGWVSEAVTAVPGSSAWFDRGFVVYSNQAKQEMLGVRAATLKKYGAVSEPTVREMAQAALERSRAGVTLAVSGIAGPGGGSRDKPVGMVCFAWCLRGRAPMSATRRFSGDREAVRRQAAVLALEGLLELLEDGPRLA